MSFSKRDIAVVKAIISCHETGKPVGDYSALVVLNDDAGITFGAHQSTHKSGSLYKIVKMYCDISNSKTAKALEPYLAGLKTSARRHEFAKDASLKSLLIKAGKEPAMQYAQESVFESNYMAPALAAVQGSGWVHPLSLAVVYDSMIHGGWTTVRNKVKPSSEKTWIKNYVAARRKWLAGNSKPIVRKTTYRMTTFETLIKNNNWDLALPITAHGVKILENHVNIWLSATTSSIQEEDATQVIVDTNPIKDEDFIPDTEESINNDLLNELPEETEPEDLTDNAADNAVDETDLNEEKPVVKEKPIIIDNNKKETTGGWHTWKTTITGVLSSLGVSATAFFAWFKESVSDPGSANFILALGIATIVLAGIFGIVYMIIRAIDKARRETHNNAVVLKEMELASRPDRYNVKVDRREEKRD